MAGGRLRRRDDTGSVTLEMVVITPVLLLLIFATIQVALWAHARNLALAAAEQGVDTGRRAGVSAGVADAGTWLDGTGDGLIEEVQIGDAGSSGTVVRIQVSGRALSVLPLVPGMWIEETAAAGVERVTPP